MLESGEKSHGSKRGGPLALRIAANAVHLHLSREPRARGVIAWPLLRVQANQRIETNAASPVPFGTGQLAGMAGRQACSICSLELMHGASTVGSCTIP